MKIRCYSKGLGLLIIAFGLVIMGGTYSSWSNSAKLNYKMSSGNMNIILPFQEDMNYRVDLMEDAKTSMKLPAEFKIESNGKNADIRFQEGLPIHQLMEGKFIRISFPMKAAENSSINTVMTKMIDFNKADGTLAMNVGKGIVVEDGRYYEMKNNNIYMQPLKFDMYSEVKSGEDASMKGIFYLQLSKESREYISGLATNTNIDESDVVEIEKPEFDFQISNGIVVEYLVNIPLEIMQQQ